MELRASAALRSSLGSMELRASAALRSSPGSMRPRLGQVPHRILRRAPDARLEVEVRAGRVARAADVADHLSLAHGAARDREATLVRIEGAEATGVRDDHDIAVAAHRAGERDGARLGRANGRAG